MLSGSDGLNKVLKKKSPDLHSTSTCWISQCRIFGKNSQTRFS